MNENQKELAIKEMKNIKEIMNNVEYKRPKPIFWMLWGIIIVVAGIIMQILYFNRTPEYIWVMWGSFSIIGYVISSIIGYKFYKDEPFPLKDPTLKHKPFQLLMWISMITLGLVMTFFLVRIKAFELIWTLWFLVTGVGIIQTGNLFRSFYWHGLIFYFFGILLIISGIIIALAESLQIWGPLLYHLLFGFCWISEGVRGRKKNKKWI